MKCFKYTIMDGNQAVVINWINRETKEEALRDLKEDYPDNNIKIIEVYPATNWSC